MNDLQSVPTTEEAIWPPAPTRATAVQVEQPTAAPIRSFWSLLRFFLPRYIGLEFVFGALYGALFGSVALIGPGFDMIGVALIGMVYGACFGAASGLILCVPAGLTAAFYVHHKAQNGAEANAIGRKLYQIIPLVVAAGGLVVPIAIMRQVFGSGFAPATQLLMQPNPIIAALAWLGTWQATKIIVGKFLKSLNEEW